MMDIWPISHFAKKFGEVMVMNLFKGGGGQYLTPRKKTDAFAPIVLKLAGHYINLLVMQEFTAEQLDSILSVCEN